MSCGGTRSLREALSSTSVSSRRRHTRLLGEVLGVVIVLVGWQSLSAAETVAVRPARRNKRQGPGLQRRNKLTSKEMEIL